MVALWCASTIPLLPSLMAPFISAGLYVAISKGEVELTPADFFDYGHLVKPIFMAGTVSTLITGLGFVLFLLPGIYFSICFLFVTPIILEANDSEIDIRGVLKDSRTIIHGNGLFFSLLAVTNTLIILIAALPLGIGLPIALPLITCINFYVFNKSK